MQVELSPKPLMRPHQVREANEERDVLQKKLRSDSIQDKGAVANQLRRLERSMAEQVPRPFQGPQKDAAIKLEAALRERIREGMPSMEEMRKAPPDALEKHQEWERRNKPRLAEWKNLVLRLNADAPDASANVANFERYRPRQSTLSMDNALIPGAQIFLPESNSPSVVFTDAQIALLEQVAPDIRNRLASLTNEQRAAVKTALDSGGNDEPQEI